MRGRDERGGGVLLWIEHVPFAIERPQGYDIPQQHSYDLVSQQIFRYFVSVDEGVETWSCSLDAIDRRRDELSNVLVADC